MIKPIETLYAGCRFRSRLEARWAVFFDSLHFKWEYEPQGYCVDGSCAYLPDFSIWPTTPGDVMLFIEVKGSDISDDDTEKMLHLAYNLPNGEAWGLLVLRDIPDPRTSGPHHILVHNIYAQEPIVQKNSVSFLPTRGGYWLYPFGWPRICGLSKEGTFTGGNALDWTIRNAGHGPPINPTIAAAYASARSARFEHGESGDR